MTSTAAVTAWRHRRNSLRARLGVRERRGRSQLLNQVEHQECGSTFRRPQPPSEQPPSGRSQSQSAGKSGEVLEAVERHDERLPWPVTSWFRSPPDAPERARLQLHPDAAGLRGDLDLAPVDDVECTVRPELAVGWPLEALVRQLGGGTGNLVDREVHHLSVTSVDADHLEAASRPSFSTNSTACCATKVGSMSRPGTASKAGSTPCSRNKRAAASPAAAPWGRSSLRLRTKTTGSGPSRPPRSCAGRTNSPRGCRRGVNEEHVGGVEASTCKRQPLSGGLRVPEIPDLLLRHLILPAHPIVDHIDSYRQPP